MLNKSFSPEELVVTGNTYADMYLAAANELGLDTEIVDAIRGTAVISGNGKSLSVRAAILGCNNLVASRVSSNKYITYMRLSRAGFRVPEFRLFPTRDYRDREQFFNAVSEYARERFPVVLKPVKGHGGRNVYAGIKDQEELRWVVEQIWMVTSQNIMLEQHVTGQQYRLKFFEHQLIDAILRKPGSVKGDGVLTIQQLIDRKNEHKESENLPKISTTPRMLRILHSAGLNLESVLAKDQEQYLCIECNQQIGGDSFRLEPEIVSRPCADYLAAVSRFVGLRWLGLDVIVDELADPKAHQTMCINETSSAHIPNAYKEGETKKSYLKYADCLLRGYFELKK